MGTTSGRDGLSIDNELSNPDGLSVNDRLTLTGFYEPVGTDLLLLQTGDFLLLQAGGKLILEAA